MNWGIFCITFLALNLDFALVLFVLLTKINHQTVTLAYLTGVSGLILVSFCIAHTLAAYFAEWQLGILGLIPLWLAFYDNDTNHSLTTPQHPFVFVLLVYLSSCASCNLGLFVPLFMHATTTTLLSSLVICGLIIPLVVKAIALINQIAVLRRWLTRFAEPITRIIFAAVGVFVLYDSGLITHLAALL